MNTELITVIANVALTLSFIIALVFGIVQVKTSNRDRRERLTLETLHSFETRDFAELLLYVINEKIPKTMKEWMTWPSENRVRFIEYGQRMETLGMLLAEKLINIYLVDKTLGSFVVGSWEKYKPLIVDMREKQPDPYLSEYFQWLAEQIDRRMKENPRKPFHEGLKVAR